MDLYWILSIFISKVSPLTINNNTNTFLGSRCDDSMKFYSNSVILCNAIPHQSRTKRSTNEKVISFRDTGNGSSLHIWSPLLHRGLSCPHQRTYEKFTAQVHWHTHAFIYCPQDTLTQPWQWPASVKIYARLYCQNVYHCESKLLKKWQYWFYKMSYWSVRCFIL